MKRDAVKVLALICVLILAATVVPLFVLSTPSDSLLKPLPNPNGYDGLVKAGQLLTADFADYKTRTREQLVTRVDDNTNALNAARQALELQCQAPVLQTLTDNASRITNMVSLRKLAQALAAEGRLAAMDERPTQAANSCLDIVRLGVQSAHGGAVVEFMIGIAIEGLGTEDLKELVGQLDAGSCRETARALEELDRQRDHWKDVVERERLVLRRISGGFRYRLARLLWPGVTDTMVAKAERTSNEQIVKSRRVMIDLAARAYELDNHHDPARVNDLVPEYLKSVPQDPDTGTNMAYER